MLMYVHKPTDLLLGVGAPALGVETERVECLWPEEEAALRVSEQPPVPMGMVTRIRKQLCMVEQQ